MKKNHKIFKVLPTVLSALFLLSGCARQFSLTAPGTTTGTSEITSSTYTPPQACNILSSNLYNFYQGQSGNIFFSPFSIITAMAMAQEGAVGPTQTQMQTVLNLNPNASARLQGFQQLIGEINAPSQPYTLATADNLWPQQNFPVLPAFINTLQTYYDSGVTAVDYINNPTGAVQTINGAVSQETYGYIPDLLSPSVISNKTRLVLTNAIYFQADWRSQFQVLDTYPSPFNLTSTSTESVSMMHQTLPAVVGNYNGAASVLALPYTNNGASLYIFLPPQGGMAGLEGRLTGSNLNAWLAANSGVMTGPSTSVTQVALSLPKFTFSSSYDLTATLSSKGMPLAFSPPGTNGANFSGIDGNLDLTISEVIHKAYINVDEKGTTAAAATGVVIVTTGDVYNPPPPPTIP
ncbi:MAG TPA: serpin family protein, partial [bacterium]|nr:serpin family protein [bacterium]